MSLTGSRVAEGGEFLGQEAFLIGQTLSHYRITDRLGAGGMGEVYRATDTNLGRDVAIKVLPPEVAQDPERLGRFRREAQLLAALNHTNIASIHGLEEADGQPFLVLELVEGEDLKERLDKGPIPLDDALEIARQIAEALEEAHAHGIVHRDLKPANLKLTPDGKVKVLDFGLAKAWAGDGTSGTSSLDLSASPTLARSGTLAGVILGTAAYMSPEQAAGKTVDKRADIWSFGVVLFEMLTGRPLFTGETASEILASVMKDEPDWQLLPEGHPSGVRRLVYRCLRKKPRERLQDIGDARLELEETLNRAGEDLGGVVPETGASLARERRARWKERVTWAGAVVIAWLAVLLAWWHDPPAPGSEVVRHLSLRTPEELPLASVTMALSPNGRHAALTPWDPYERRRLWMWSLDTPGVRPIDGTEGAIAPFWSPDSAFVAFLVFEKGTGTLRKLDLATGGIQTICSSPGIRWNRGSWNAEGQIILLADHLASEPGRVEEGSTAIHTVPASGGELKPLLPPGEPGPEGLVHWPQFLPDGRRFLFGDTSEDSELRGTWVSSLDSPRERRRVLPDVMWTRYAAPGHLLYVRDGSLMAQPFDATRARVTSPATAVVPSVAIFPGMPQASIGQFAVSPNGALAYLQDEGSLDSTLTWFDRRGARLGTLGKPDRYLQIQMAPDDRRVVAQISPGDTWDDLWTLDVARGVATRVTSDPEQDGDAVWAPNGRELYFSSRRGGGQMRLYRQRLDGGSVELLRDMDVDAFSEAVSPDGETLVFVHTGNQGIWTMPLIGPGEPELLVEGDHAFDGPRVSPGGRWLAYSSDETGEWEIYLMPFGWNGERVRVSPAGGRQPRWRGDGKELFYLTPDGQLMAVDVEDHGERIEVGLPDLLFEAGASSAWFNEYAVTSDGQRFLVITPTEDSPRALNLILNWTGLLE